MEQINTVDFMAVTHTDVKSTVCKITLFEDYSIYSYGKIKIVLEYQYASIS